MIAQQFSSRMHPDIDGTTIELHRPSFGTMKRCFFRVIDGFPDFANGYQQQGGEIAPFTTARPHVMSFMTRQALMHPELTTFFATRTYRAHHLGSDEAKAEFILNQASDLCEEAVLDNHPERVGKEIAKLLGVAKTPTTVTVVVAPSSKQESRLDQLHEALEGMTSASIVADQSLAGVTLRAVIGESDLRVMPVDEYSIDTGIMVATALQHNMSRVA